jgi:hypothetical protein
VAVGDVATWVSAIGTIAAVVVALFLAGRGERRRYRAELRQQAEHVTAWISGPHRKADESSTGFVVPISIQNSSNQLAYRVVVSIVNDLRAASPHVSLLGSVRWFFNARGWGKEMALKRPLRDDLKAALGYRGFMRELPDAFRRGMDEATAAYKFRAFIGELPPGRTDITIEYPGGGMQFRAAVQLVFRDAGGRVWLRESTGHLTKLRKKDSLEHFQARYHLYEPLDWEYPART